MYVVVLLPLPTTDYRIDQNFRRSTITGGYAKTFIDMCLNDNIKSLTSASTFIVIQGQWHIISFCFSITTARLAAMSHTEVDLVEAIHCGRCI